MTSKNVYGSIEEFEKLMGEEGEGRKHMSPNDDNIEVVDTAERDDDDRPRTEIAGFEGAIRYEVTGTRECGRRRFKIITRCAWTCMCINIWRGTRWAVMPSGKRRVITRVFN